MNLHESRRAITALRVPHHLWSSILPIVELANRPTHAVDCELRKVKFFRLALVRSSPAERPKSTISLSFAVRACKRV